MRTGGILLPELDDFYIPEESIDSAGSVLWGDIGGDITNQADLYGEFQPLNDWLTDFSDLCAFGANGDIFYVDNSGDVSRLPIGTTGQTLIVSGSGFPYWGTPGAGSLNINDLGDVAIVSADTNDLLQFDGTNWVDKTITEIANQISFASLSDVTITAPANNQIPVYQSGVWINTNPATVGGNISIGDLSDVDITGVSVGDVLIRDVSGNFLPGDAVADLVVGNLNLNDLGDVSAASPSDGQVIAYNNSGSSWDLKTLGSDDIVNESSVSGSNVSQALDDLEGQINSMPPFLTQEEIEDFIADMFVNGDHTNISVTYDDANSEVDLAVSLAINDLTDVDTAGASNGEAVIHNGSSFVVGEPTVNSVGGSRIVTGTVQDGTILAGTGFTAALIGANLHITPTTAFGDQCVMTWYYTSNAGTHLGQSETLTGPTTFSTDDSTHGGGVRHYFRIIGPA